jgi:uncharacterized protein (TIGR00730 family)
MNVTVFGGAQAKPGDKLYNDALTLGGMLARSGHTVLTGGYYGSMEAISRGAAEAGGHVIGVTCAEIESWRATIHANAWVQEEIKIATLQDRLMTLIDMADASLALPGGVGTLTEIVMQWNRMVIRAIPLKPLILIGPGWGQVIQTVLSAQDMYIPVDDRGLVQLVPDIHQAVALLNGQA